MYIEHSFDKIPDLMVFIRELLTGVENKSVVIYTHCEVRKQNEQSISTLNLWYVIRHFVCKGREIGSPAVQCPHLEFSPSGRGVANYYIYIHSDYTLYSRDWHCHLEFRTSGRGVANYYTHIHNDYTLLCNTKDNK